ncbi:hypothetical protein BT96DRAFT_995949 [Gymnopus androsaceus JB14]|uniref:DUF6534 domain-containing protein n=1 Tax=Gymnopus androsaceus JB14 TaxID=1447944 RepID=A0A6A4HGW6_9AGAR|nr:hypothetical protein BT96DRAFT_995949 [Gymnopus androsaceus JB14]
MPPSFFPNPLPAFNISTSVGAFEIGTLVAATLFGATCIQTYLYFERYPKDHRLIKAMVIAVWLLELGHTIAICHALYTMTITWYGEPELLAVPPASLEVSILLSGFIGPLEQAWFTRRLYVFSKNLWLTTLCGLLSFGRFFGSIAYASLAFQSEIRRETVTAFELQYWWIFTCIVVLGAVNDVLLACSLAWYLKKTKEHIFSRVSKLLDRLIIWAVETSSITSIDDDLLFHNAHEFRVHWDIPMSFQVIKVYANALLASLNARASLAHRFDEVVTLEDLSGSSSNFSRQRPLSMFQPLSSLGYRGECSDDMEINTGFSPTPPISNRIIRFNGEAAFPKETNSKNPADRYRRSSIICKR